MDEVIHGEEGLSNFQVLWEDGERKFCRAVKRRGDQITSVLVSLPISEHPSRVIVERLAYEFALRDELDSAWAVRPRDLHRNPGQTVLLLEDPGGKPLSQELGSSLEVGRFLQLAIGAS